MNVTAIPPIARVAAPYPARVPLVNDTQPTFEAERLAREAAIRDAQRSRQAQAAWEAQRIARTREAADTARADTAADVRAPAAVALDGRIALDTELAPAFDPNILRDQYADTRLRRAVDAYAAQADSAVQQRAGNSNDLGTIEGLTPLQPYRVAMGNPQVQEWQAAVAVKAAAVGVPAVANIGATENVTDNARYRAGFAQEKTA